MNTRLHKRKTIKEAMVALYPDLFRHPVPEKAVDACIRLDPKLNAIFWGQQECIITEEDRAKSIL